MILILDVIIYINNDPTWNQHSLRPIFAHGQVDKKNKGGAKSKAKPKKGKKVVDDEDEGGEDHETDDEEDVKEDSEDPDKEDSEGLPDWINTDGEETEAPSEDPSCMDLGEDETGKKPSAKAKAKAKAKAGAKAAAKAKAKGKAKAKSKSTKEKKPRKKSKKSEDEEDAEDGPEFGDDAEDEQDGDEEEEEVVTVRESKKAEKKPKEKSQKKQKRESEKAWPMLAQHLCSCMPNVQCPFPSSFSQASGKSAAQKLRKLAHGGSWGSTWIMWCAQGLRPVGMTEMWGHFTLNNTPKKYGARLTSASQSDEFCRPPLLVFHHKMMILWFVVSLEYQKPHPSAFMTINFIFGIDLNQTFHCFLIIICFAGVQVRLKEHDGWLFITRWWFSLSRLSCQLGVP